ncbi:D-3-phosphoglycerate dehydrogenase 3, chloroplastic-like [Vicia villosa]|uniref:D-3-phosphoglycerate dehydrogenase 3, chloroplastic-like n=1 Tax=Vicia villosa TaxID=3911 RepID=UPI00273AD7E1|nr:D-3-phosphoglycerate dehydrogenase 3, chloroplastic-like [Vicia villosa]
MVRDGRLKKKKKKESKGVRGTCLSSRAYQEAHASWDGEGGGCLLVQERQSRLPLREKPTIMVSEKLREAGLQVLRKLGNVVCAYDLSPEEFCTKISTCDTLIMRSGTKFTRKVFEAGKGKLKVVGRAGVRIDNVNLHAATEFGCLVVNAAEHGIALLAAMACNVSQADASLKAGTVHVYNLDQVCVSF